MAGNAREQNGGHACKPHRDQANECRGVANVLAVNCRSQLARLRADKELGERIVCWCTSTKPSRQR